MRFKNLHTNQLVILLFSPFRRSRLLFYFLIPFSLNLANAQCDNVTDGGTIAGDETACAQPLFDPSVIVSVSPATGGSGDLEYMWMKTTGDPSSPFNTWQVIPGAHGDSLDPSPISVTTYYGRCARRKGCSEFLGETNIITKKVQCCNLLVSINPGTASLCPGNSLQLSAGTTESNLTFQWAASGGNFDNATSANPLYSMSIPGEYKIYLMTTQDDCTVTDSITVTVSTSIEANISTQSPSCYSGNDGSINITPTGGTPGYTYNWSNSLPNNPNVENILAGLYFVTITDANGCTADTSIILSNPDQISLQTSHTNPDCRLTNGLATVTASGGTPGYSFIWDDPAGQQSDTASNLGAGTYQVVVTDANGCTASASVTIDSVSASDIQLTTSITNAGCNDTDGAIDLTISGGIAPYTISWDNNQGSVEDPNNLEAGTYTVTVTDAAGCLATTVAVVGQEASFSIQIESENITCIDANDGVLHAEITGGTAPFSYEWNNNLGTDTTLSGLGAGTYMLTVTDAAGCLETASMTLVDPAPLVLTVNTSDLACTDSTGSAIAKVSGGTAGYTFLWNDPDAQTTQTALNLSTGTYTVTVTDANGCTISESTNITTPETVALSAATTQPTCETPLGSIDLNISGGGTNPVISWDNGLPNTEDQDSLDPGTYSVTVTNAAGCSATLSETIHTPGLTVTVTTTDVNCSNLLGGSITANIQNGAEPFTYAWNNSLGNSATHTGLAHGFYEVTVTDDNGCTGTASGKVRGPDTISVQVVADDAGCFSDDGRIRIDASGGTPEYSFQWSPNSDTTSIVNGLAPGTYRYTVSDANGCSFSDEIIISRESNCDTCDVQGGTISTTDATTVCVGDGLEDNVTVSLTGNSGANTGWIITDESLNILELHDDNTFNFEGAGIGTCLIWSISYKDPLERLVIGQNAGNLSGCFDLSNSIKVVRQDSCLDTCDQFIVLIHNPGTSQPVCPGTPVSLSADPSDANYTYSWAASGGTFSDANSASTVYTTTTPGIHEIILTTRQGDCSWTDTSIVKISEGVELSVSKIDIACPGENTGSVSVEINKGTLPVTYSWDNGLAGNASHTGLSAGTYNLTVTDAIGCSATTSLTLVELSGLTVNLNKTDNFCFGENTGSISATVNSGMPPYAITWSNGAVNINSIDSLAAGTYSVTITDSFGCRITESVQIEENPRLNTSISGTNPICDNSGSALVQVSGGTAPYSYSWSDPGNQNTDMASNLSEGLYYVTVTDARSCTTIDSIRLIETDGISCSIFVASDITTFNGIEGSLGVQASGGTNYTYRWNNGGRDSVIVNLSTNTYIVTVTDESNCTCTDTFKLENPAKLGDFVFEDLESNGIQDADDPGLDGVSIQLSGQTYYGSFLVKDTVSQNNGMYMFWVPPGSYKITLLDGLGYDITLPNQGDNDNLDNDIDPDTGMSDPVTLEPGDTVFNLDIGLVYTQPCDNVLLGGSISGDETLCGPEADPSLITSLSLPSGGSGPIEYLWLMSHKNTYHPGDPDWVEIPNSNSPDYDPGVISQTTYYIRCSRRKGCDNYPGETDIVRKTIEDCATDPVVENLRTIIQEAQIALVWDGKIPGPGGNFIIEKSNDGSDFKVIATLKSHPIEEMKEYQFMDKTPSLGENYYRVQAFLPNQEKIMSNIAMAMVKGEKNQKVMVYPNPTRHKLTIHFLEQISETVELQIVNGFGQVVRELKIEMPTNRFQIDISQLPSSMYYIKFRNRELKWSGNRIYKSEE